MFQKNTYTQVDRHTILYMSNQVDATTNKTKKLKKTNEPTFHELVSFKILIAVTDV